MVRATQMKIIPWLGVVLLFFLTGCLSLRVWVCKIAVQVCSIGIVALYLKYCVGGFQYPGSLVNEPVEVFGYALKKVHEKPLSKVYYN